MIIIYLSSTPVERVVDYSPLSSLPLTFSIPADTSECVVIEIVNDTVEELNNEEFLVMMSNPMPLLEDIVLNGVTVRVEIADCK